MHVHGCMEGVDKDVIHPLSLRGVLLVRYVLCCYLYLSIHSGACLIIPYSDLIMACPRARRVREQTVVPTVVKHLAATRTDLRSAKGMLSASLVLHVALFLVQVPPKHKVLAAKAQGAQAHTNLRDSIERLKGEIHMLDAAEAATRLREISRRTPPPRQNKVDHMVVLFMENRPSDHYFGCMNLPGMDGIPPEGRLIPRHPAYADHNASGGVVNVTCGTAKYICDKPPAYSTWDSKFAPDAPCVSQSVSAAVASGRA